MMFSSLSSRICANSCATRVQAIKPQPFFKPKVAFRPPRFVTGPKFSLGLQSRTFSKETLSIPFLEAKCSHSSDLLKGLIIAVCVAGVYYYYNLESVPITGRKRMLDVSKATELSLANKTFEMLIKEHKNNLLPADHIDCAAVKRVGMRLIEASGVESLKELDWDFIVIDSPEVNACVLPNGKVCIFSGIFELMQDETGMAMVLAHEIGHVVARHSAEHLSLGRFLWNGESVSRFMGLDSVGDWLSSRISRMPFQRFCESEADHIGLILLARAKYDPEKSLGLWERLKETSTDDDSATHPSGQERIDNIKKWLPDAIKVAQQ